ncbi:hypothetical protein BH09BAC6_BH09BAC6_19880 [soil metagenome]
MNPAISYIWQQNHESMTKIYKHPIFAILLLVLSGCIASKYGSARKSESIVMQAHQKPDIVSMALLQQQKIPTYASRGKSRGVVNSLSGGFISMGVSAVKQLIANDRKRYTAEWKYGLKDLYFYDQLSEEGPFDPIGMQFNGFKLVRSFNNNGQVDTAMTADIELDTSHPDEIINNSLFRLKLRKLRFNYSKARVPVGKDTINVDIEITFNTSYVGKDGQLYKDVELGKFYLNLRKAPLNKGTAGYDAYYNKLNNKTLDGKCFIVPRSYGYYVDTANMVKPCYSMGAYTISVKVIESSKDYFVSTLLNSGTDIIIDYETDYFKKKVSSKLKNK